MRTARSWLAFPDLGRGGRLRTPRRTGVVLHAASGAEGLASCGIGRRAISSAPVAGRDICAVRLVVARLTIAPTRATHSRLEGRDAGALGPASD